MTAQVKIGNEKVLRKAQEASEETDEQRRLDFERNAQAHLPKGNTMQRLEGTTMQRVDGIR